MTIIQIFIILFALFAIIHTFKQFRRGKLKLAWLFIWIIFWGTVGFVTFLPQTSDTLARIVGIGRGADVVVYLSLVGLFYLVFRLFVKIEETEREITKLVRLIAVGEVKKEKSKEGEK